MFDVLKKATRKLLGTEIATRQTDPYFFTALNLLPNPDPILRKLGKSQEVYDAILSDAHVMGELRPIRAGIISYEWRIVAGGESPDDIRAFEFAQAVYAKRPAPNMGWADVFWTMQEAILRGQRIHEVVWELVDGLQTPVMVVDRPNRRFVYDGNNALRVITREAMIEGEAAPNYKFLVSRHMPSYENPYGVALLSNCFWAYTFKHTGFRYFARFCEKYGMPWAIGKYPYGTDQKTIDELANNLAKMVEDAVAAIPDAGEVQLIESASAGQALPQERLIELCNREMSKCLNSQTLASEVNGQGSYAAAQTHRAREQGNSTADRKIVEDTNNELLAWMTEINFAGAVPPRFEFYEESEARQEWVDVLKTARDFVDIPVKFAHERLQIPQPVDGEPVLPRTAATPPTPVAQFSAATPETDPTPITNYTQQLAEQTSGAINALTAQIKLIVDGETNLNDLSAKIINAYGDLDTSELQKRLELAFILADLSGRYAVQQGN